MGVIKCKMCGGDLNISEGNTVAECEYCGSLQTVPTTDSEKKINLFARANRLRLACEFDKAAGVYENIVAEFPEEAEAYWGLVLCRYGIEYVDDPRTGKKIPTCHRSSFDSIMEDSDFEQVLENADVVARRVYREEAKAIEELRKGILGVSSKEDPYDIFICYKETDEKGNRTIDSVIAQDVYDALTEKGYRVFFSRITLEDKLGEEYEPYIFAALNSAKVMLAFGTDYEYFNAVWVKNEWSRFLKLMAQDKSKHLIPCYKKLDAYDMPKEFAKLQAQDMGKVGATQDLLRGIDKIFSTEKVALTSNSIESQLEFQAKVQADNLVQLGVMSLNAGDQQKGIQQFEEAIKVDSNHIGAYLGLVRATNGDASIPYCKRIESYSTQQVINWLKKNPDMLNNSYFPLLDSIIRNTQSVALTKAVLEAGANPNGQYALYYAILSKNRGELTKTLVEFGVDVNKDYQLSFGDTTEMRSPLTDIIWQAKDSVLAEFLIDNGANVNYTSKNSKDESWSLLDMAVRSNNESMVQLLLEKGADPNSGRWYISGYSHGDLKTFYHVLSEAIWNVKNINIIHLLLEHGANPNYQYTDYFTHGSSKLADGRKLCTGLYDAICFFESDEALKMLLSAGANPSATYEYMSMDTDDYGRTAIVPILAIAALKGKTKEMEMLLKAGASFDEMCYEKRVYPDGEGSVPLKKCDCRFPETIKGILYNWGWKGPSFFKGMYLSFRY